MKNKAKNISVLIVEDEIVLQDVYKFVLGTSGYEVHTADNGLEGMKQIKKVRPDVILLDLFMPIMDGKEFLNNYDASQYPETKIIVYTNLSDRQVKEQMLELGAHRYCLKSSMAPKDLLKLVDEVANE